MNVNCPKCQSENQVNAPAQGGVIRVVCARCATIFEARFNQGAPPDHNLGQPSMPPLAASASASNQGRDPYATRVEPDFDEVLDIPLAGQSDYQANESAPVFEDVFTTTADDFAPAPTPPDPRVTVPLSRHMPEPEFEPPPETQFNTKFDTQFDPQPDAQIEPQFGAQFDSQFDSQFDTQSQFGAQFDSSYDAQPASQEAFAPSESEQNGHMPPPLLTSWPVLSGEADPSAARQGSSSSTKASRVFVRVILVVFVFGILGFAALFFLRDKFPGNQSTNNVATNRPPAGDQNASGAGGETKPVTSPNAQPAESKATGTSESKATDKPVSQEPTKKAEPEPAKKDPAGAAATTSSKPPETAKPPAENKSQNAAKPAPLDVPFGHAVKPGEGSITVQVASFNNQAQADERAAALKSAGIEARVVKADIPGRGPWYRVQLGRFTTREEAMRYGKQLIARGLVKDAIPASYQAQR